MRQSTYLVRDLAGSIENSPPACPAVKQQTRAVFLGYNVRQNIRHKLCVGQQNLQQPHQRCQLRRLVASTTVLMPLCLLSILYTVFCLQNTANEICFSLFAMYAGYGLLLCATATAAAAVSVMCLTSRYYRRSLPVTPGPQRFPMKILLGLLLTQDCTRQMYFLSAGNKQCHSAEG